MTPKPHPAPQPGELDVEGLMERLRTIAEGGKPHTAWQLCEECLEALTRLQAERDSLIATRTDDMNDVVLVGIDRDGWKARAEAAEAKLAELRAVVKALTCSSSHTRVFLTSREKMHPEGVALWDEAISNGKAALDRLGQGEGEQQP